MKKLAVDGHFCRFNEFRQTKEFLRTSAFKLVSHVVALQPGQLQLPHRHARYAAHIAITRVRVGVLVAL